MLSYTKCIDKAVAGRESFFIILPPVIVISFGEFTAIISFPLKNSISLTLSYVIRFQFYIPGPLLYLSSFINCWHAYTNLESEKVSADIF